MRKTFALCALTLMLSAGGLAACDDAEGPAEQTGERIDEAVQDTKRAVEDATD